MLVKYYLSDSVKVHLKISLEASKTLSQPCIEVYYLSLCLSATCQN